MRKLLAALFALALSLLAACAPATAPAPSVATTVEADLAIVGAILVHPERDEAVAIERDATILVRGNRIVGVGRGLAPSPGAKVIDARGKWVIPGLVDSHVHFFQSGNLYTRPDAADFNAVVRYADEVARNKARLPVTFRTWLASGVTSVADVGGPFWNFTVRDAAAMSEAAPRMAVAGPLISMVDRAKLDLGDPPIIKITNPAAARALVKRQLPYKPDFIKVWYIHRKGDDLAAQEAIVRAAAEEAHAAGIRLAVHATELTVAKSALRAGADYLVHSVVDAPVDDEFIALAKKRNAIYCPTIFVMSSYEMALSNQWVATDAEKRLADPEILDSMHDLDKIPKAKIPPRVAQLIEKHPAIRTAPAIPANLKKVWDAGITVAMGTDAGNIGTLHGPSVFREMELMVQAGLTPLQVLRSATVNGAKVMGLERNAGVIAPGRLADLVVLDADPLADIGNASRIHAVIKDGRQVGR
ncbi:MAG TPA: amidohydrolase family protein [Usitatibacter sp.]|nr:amidohydrolase family protein [Usitatibacter sp.]